SGARTPSKTSRSVRPRPRNGRIDAPGGRRTPRRTSRRDDCRAGTGDTSSAPPSRRDRDRSGRWRRLSLTPCEGPCSGTVHHNGRRGGYRRRWCEALGFEILARVLTRPGFLQESDTKAAEKHGGNMTATKHGGSSLDFGPDQIGSLPRKD